MPHLRKKNMAKQIELEQQIHRAEDAYKQDMTPIQLTYLSLSLTLSSIRKLIMPNSEPDRSSLKRGTKQEECWQDI